MRLVRRPNRIWVFGLPDRPPIPPCILGAPNHPFMPLTEPKPMVIYSRFPKHHPSHQRADRGIVPFDYQALMESSAFLQDEVAADHRTILFSDPGA